MDPIIPLAVASLSIPMVFIGYLLVAIGGQVFGFWKLS